MGKGEKEEVSFDVASMFGMRGYKDGAVFAASKHAAVGMVRSAALEGFGVTSGLIWGVSMSRAFRDLRSGRPDCSDCLR